MDAGLSPARAMRARHRHELRTLTYVTLDQANGGIIRNLTQEGIAVQLVAAVRPRQQMRVRFELRHPRLRVETRGEVVWATFSGQCGIRFLDLPPRAARQIDEWIFGNLLEGIPLSFPSNTPASNQPASNQFALNHPALNHPALNRPAGDECSRPDQRARLEAGVEEDGLLVSAAPVKVIELPSRSATDRPATDRPATDRPVTDRFSREPARSGFDQKMRSDESMPHAFMNFDLLEGRGGSVHSEAMEIPQPARALDWLSQPLSGRGLMWTVNVLAVVAGLLLFVVVFLSVTRELPQWPYAFAGAATVLVAALYWGFFKFLGGSSPGARLARLAGYDLEEEEEIAARFR